MLGRVGGMVLAVGMLSLLILQTACGSGRAGAGSGQRLIVLGIDGMDYELSRRLIAEGRLPNLARLAETGTFSALETSVPPLSPVAWSNFITGMDAGGHGIFDFFHRDPETMIPYFSTSRTEESDKVLKLGKWQIPLAGGKTVLLRRGRPFWEVLEENGIETTVIRMPANYPPSGKASRELSGMGTPDILGTYGIFSFYSTKRLRQKGVAGGQLYPLYLKGDVAEGRLYGPDNPFLVEQKKLAIEFTLYRDPREPVAKLVLGDEERIVTVGEWSGWIPFEFSMMPTQSLRGMCRVYLKQTHPEVEIYFSPINFDPEQPEAVISTPESYAAELAEATGRFYTQGMPEDTQSLRGGVLTEEEFLAQARIAGEEIEEQFKHVLERFESGLLFYYFGNVDQVSHLMWGSMDPEHPTYDPEVDGPLADVVPGLYEAIDRVVGYTLDHMGEGTTLIVMSDHGFTSWRRSFSLNTWLKEHGYLAVRNPSLKNDPGGFANVDWSRTRAYGLGFNGLYLNLRGREENGIVDQGDRRALMEEIADKLIETIDPATGKPAITKAYLREDEYRDRGVLEIGPDVVVGYAKGTRGSDQSALGGVPPEILGDNMERWTGDHGMDHETVPGVLFTNRPLRAPATSLKTLAGAILGEFGIDGFPGRKGGTTGG